MSQKGNLIFDHQCAYAKGYLQLCSKTWLAPSSKNQEPQISYNIWIT